MRSFKSHFGVIFPLIIILFSYQFTSLASGVLKNYENSMGKDYNIIIVSQNELKKDEIKAKISTFKDLEILSSKAILDRLKQDISAKNLSVLSNMLPKFYSLQLSSFPSQKYLKDIQGILMKIEGVKSVQVFAKTHNKIYKILKLAKSIFDIFAILVAIMGVMLILKQIRIWLYEHKNRVEVMSLFGAPFWLKSTLLYRLAIIDSFVATLILFGLNFALLNLKNPQNFLKDLGFELPNLNLLFEGLTTFGLSLLITIIAVSVVMIQTRLSK